MSICKLALLFLSAIVFRLVSASSSFMQQLHKDLLADHECTAPPARGISISLQLYFAGILEINVDRSELIAKAVFRQRWQEKRLSWNPEEYGGIMMTSIFTDSHKENPCMWAPDLIMLNNALSESELQSANTNIQHDGSVY